MRGRAARAAWRAGGQSIASAPSLDPFLSLPPGLTMAGMAVAVRPLTKSDVPVCAALLAARHARDRSRQPFLPPAFESAEHTLPFIESALGQAGARGVVAIEAGDVVGYLIGAPVQEPVNTVGAQFTPERGFRIVYPGHAVAGSAAPLVYRQMYAALSEPFIRAGYFDHDVYVSATDRDLIEVWAGLGFGRLAVCALRPVEPLPTAAVEADIRRATVDDLDEVLRLDEELERHHASPPTYLPYRWEARPAFRTMMESLLTSEENVYFLALQDGRPAGMNSVLASGFNHPMQRPESSCYLLQGIVSAAVRGSGLGRALLARSLRWAKDQGYAYCALHFFSANILGADFWLGNGFQPVEYRLSRTIDRRAIWNEPLPVDANA